MAKSISDIRTAPEKLQLHSFKRWVHHSSGIPRSQTLLSGKVGRGSSAYVYLTLSLFDLRNSFSVFINRVGF